MRSGMRLNGKRGSSGPELGRGATGLTGRGRTVERGAGVPSWGLVVLEMFAGGG